MHEAIVNKNNQQTTQRTLEGRYYTFINSKGLCISQTWWNTAKSAVHPHLSLPRRSNESSHNAIDCVISGNTVVMEAAGQRVH